MLAQFLKGIQFKFTELTRLVQKIAEKSRTMWTTTKSRVLYVHARPMHATQFHQLINLISFPIFVATISNVVAKRKKNRETVKVHVGAVQSKKKKYTQIAVFYNPLRGSALQFSVALLNPRGVWMRPKKLRLNYQLRFGRDFLCFFFFLLRVWPPPLGNQFGI